MSSSLLSQHKHSMHHSDFKNIATFSQFKVSHKPVGLVPVNIILNIEQLMCIPQFKIRIALDSLWKILPGLARNNLN